MAQRIYITTNKDTGSRRLVRASSQAVARSHIAKDLIGVEVANTDDVFELASSGAKVEETSSEQANRELGE